MIISMLDTDLYKLTTSYAYMSKYPQAQGRYMLIDRGNLRVTDMDYSNLYERFENLKNLQLAGHEEQWCKNNIPFIPNYYWEWLRTFRFDPEKINMAVTPDGRLKIEVIDYLYKATLYEVPILAILSEYFCADKNTKLEWDDYTKIREKTKAKIDIANSAGFKFAEFGTRRRYSYEVQLNVVSTLAELGKDCCVGTSNVYLAMLNDIKPIGTHPHEWFMFHGAQFGYKHANYLALEAWQEIYQGDLGIALADTYTSDVFFQNFSLKHAKLFDGIRQDSGNPLDFKDKAIKRYKELGIDPMTKTIVFSDALDFNTAKCISIVCKDEINCSFGIGTNLTNDVDGVEPCNIVMKLATCKMNSKQPGYDTVKLSDTSDKSIGPRIEIEIAQHQLGID